MNKCRETTCFEIFHPGYDHFGIELYCPQCGSVIEINTERLDVDIELDCKSCQARLRLTLKLLIRWEWDDAVGTV